MATGAALVVHILARVDLRVGLSVAFVMIVGAFWWADHRASPGDRKAFRQRAQAGAVAGVVATLAYDISRSVLSYFDPSPYNPFEALPRFGELLVGQGAAPALLFAVGGAIHAINGIAFGIAFALLIRPASVLTGMVWGLGLEAFQLTLYPGWLDIRAFREFTQISAIGHLVYGATLGNLVTRQLRRSRVPTETDAP
jgi:hypothetical protein